MALGAGIAVAAVAVSPLLDGEAASNLTAHMVQHVLLLTVAPPLLVLGAARGPSSAAWILPAVVVHGLVLLGWHLPALYDAADAHLAVHVAEHLTFIAAGCLLWWAIGVGHGRVGGLSVLALFGATVPGTALGAAMTLAAHPWYSAYPSLGDQQGAGVVMWSLAGALYAVAGGALVPAWLARESR
jgi:putative membrane protein